MRPSTLWPRRLKFGPTSVRVRLVTVSINIEVSRFKSPVLLFRAKLRHVWLLSLYSYEFRFCINTRPGCLMSGTRYLSERPLP